MPAPVVLFDGVCNFCNASVDFVIERERASVLCFAPLQSDPAKDLLAEAGAGDIRGDGDPSSIVLVEGGRVYVASTAALRIAGYLRAPYRWLRVLLLVPRPIRDWLYGVFARRRYRWFGKAERCRVPTPELRARFLA